MPIRRFSLILIVLIGVAECGLAIWQSRTLQPSLAPVFSWPEAAAHFSHSENLEHTFEQYKCDRAAEYQTTAGDGIKLASVYLEWDRVEAGPAMGFAAHGPEICNTALGYKLLGIDANRIFEVPGTVPIRFDCTRFADREGKTVYMYKTAWVQGLGSWQLRDEGNQRLERLKRSFLRHTGEARVVLTAVYGAPDPEQAWQTFQTQVINQFVWKSTNS